MYVTGTDFVKERLGYDVVDVQANQPHLRHLLANPHLQSSLQRYHMGNSSLRDFAYITQRMFFSKASPLLVQISKPLTEQLFNNPTAVRIGIQIRLGDAYMSGPGSTADGLLESVQRKDDHRYSAT